MVKRLLRGLVSFLCGFALVTGLAITVYGNEKEEKNKPAHHMEIKNPFLQFSSYTKIYNNVAYITLTSISSYNAESFWLDTTLIMLKKIPKIVIYMNNPGGSVFSGADIADRIRIVRAAGIHIEMQASGIVASAAIPVFLSATHRIASKNTIFLIHPATIFKWLTAETLKDLESQAEMIKMSREKYADIVSSRSNLSKEDVIKLMSKDSWFDVYKAKEWGFVDQIL